MGTPFLGEIRVVAFNFPPRGWALCNGQILPINQNQALFSILGTTYGGDGRVNFALPNLQGRVPVGMGQAPGLTSRTLGETGGTNAVTLTANELPGHTHAANASTSAATTGNPANALLAQGALPNFGNSGGTALYGNLATTGGSQPHDNQQPYLGLHFVIALNGIFPSRS